MPEGTRSKGKGLGEFKAGAFRTAISAGVPIVPIIVSDWYKNVDINKFSSGEIKIKILPEILTSDMDTSQAEILATSVRDIMINRLTELNQA